MNNIIILVLCVIGGLFLFLTLIRKNSNLLDIRFICYQHFQVFKGNWLQIISVFIIPIVFAIGIVQVRSVDKETLNNLNVVLSILIAMFFSVLSILTTLDGKSKGNKYQKVLTETFTTTVFEIIICLFILLISFVALFIGIFKESIFLKIISGVIYYLTIVAILNMLTVIKRIKLLFDNR